MPSSHLKQLSCLVRVGGVNWIGDKTRQFLVVLSIFETDNDDDEIAYFTVRWKTKELVLSTAPETWDNTDKDSKNRKRSH